MLTEYTRQAASGAACAGGLGNTGRGADSGGTSGLGPKKWSIRRQKRKKPTRCSLPPRLGSVVSAVLGGCALEHPQIKELEAPLGSSNLASAALGALFGRVINLT